METIICLDGFTLNPGDLSWQGFESQGSFILHDRTSSDQVVSRAQSATALLTNKTPLTRQTLEQCPNLKYIGVLATGYNIVDIEAARELDISVTNVPTYSTESVAQHTMALLLDLSRQVHAHHLAVQQGDWVSSPDFCFTVSPIRSLEGLTMGFIGLGRIGGSTARIAHAMGMEVVAHTRSQSRPEELGDTPVDFVSLEQLLSKSDVVSLHCPLTPETEKLINADRIAHMKPDAYLINTSRGPLLDSPAVAEALREGRLGAVAVDVLETEPPPADHPLLNCPKALVTPHVAWCALKSRESLMLQAADNLAQFLAGTPVNVVN